MKVSVVIPAFNEEKHIGKCLESLKSQTVAPFEIVVVNNNSTDHTETIAKQAGVLVVHESQQGIVHARNKGFNLARGDVIARCDADTILSKNWIEEIIKTMNIKDVIGVSGPAKYYDAPFFIRPTIFSKMFFLFMNLIQGHHTLLGFNMAIRRDAWEKVKKEVCKDGGIKHEDIDLAMHLAKYGRIVYDPKLIVSSSARRILKSPISFFIDYPVMLLGNFRHR